MIFAERFSTCLRQKTTCLVLCDNLETETPIGGV